MPVEGADQRTLPALRPQVGVDLEAGLAGDPHRPAGQLGGGRVGRLGDEHHVDVADVVQLAAAALAHRDHGQPTVLAAQLGHRDRERGLQRRRGQVGEPGRDLLQVEHRQLRLAHRGQVGGRQHQQLVPVGGAQRVTPRPSRCSVAADPPLLPAGESVRVGPDRGQHGGQRPVIGPVAVGGQPVPAVGVADQVIAQRGRAAEQREQPAAQPDVACAAPRRARPGRGPRANSRSTARSARSGSGLRANAHMIGSAPSVGLSPFHQPSSASVGLGPRPGQPEPGQ